MNTNSQRTGIVKASAHAVLKLVIVLLASGLGATAVYALPVKLADIPVPLNADIQIVSDNMVHNGNPLSLATYSSSQPLDETAEFYRHIWANEQTDSPTPGFVEAIAGEWLLISRLQDGYNTVVQLSLADPYKSTGYLSIMPIPGSASNKTINRSLNSTSAPDGLELLSSTQTGDGTRVSELSVYSSTQSIESATRHYVQHLLDKSWTLVSERDHGQSKVVLLNRQSKRIEIVVNDDARKGGTVIVVNETQDRG